MCYGQTSVQSSEQDSQEGQAPEKESLAGLILQESISGMTTDADNKVNFEAKKARFNKEKNIFQMDESVKIETEDGLKLESEHLAWNQQEGRVYTDLPVKISKEDNFEIQGLGLDAQPSLKKAQVNEDVEVKIPLQDEGFILINCDGPLEIDYEQGTAVFLNNVEVHQKDSQLFANKATVYFSQEAQTIDRVVAEGNVRIVRGKDTSFSEKAIYHATSKRVVLEGRPRLVIFPQEDQDFLQ